MKRLENRFDNWNVRYSNRIHSDNYQLKDKKDQDKKTGPIAKTAISLAVLTGLIFGLGAYSYNSKKLNTIPIRIDGEKIEFHYSPKQIKDKEIKQCLVVWEKMKTGWTSDGELIKYPIGHLYVFNDINSKEIIGKYAVAGGYVDTIKDGVYVLTRFYLWPPFNNEETGKEELKGKDEDNPWGYGKFYQCKVDKENESDDTMDLLTKKDIKRSINPEKKYIHGTALRKEKAYFSKKWNRNKNVYYRFTPGPTIGCTRASNPSIDILEEAIDFKVTRIAYIDNIKKY